MTSGRMNISSFDPIGRLHVGAISALHTNQHARFLRYYLEADVRENDSNLFKSDAIAPASAVADHWEDGIEDSTSFLEILKEFQEYEHNRSISDSSSKNIFRTYRLLASNSIEAFQVFNCGRNSGNRIMQMR